MITWIKALWARYVPYTLNQPENMPVEPSTSPVEPVPAPEYPDARIQPPVPVQHSTVPSMIVAWAEAISQGEGAAPASNNPGNMKYTTLTASWGATRGRAATDGGWLCQFATQEAGFGALCNFLKLACEGELIISHPRPCSLQAFTVKYAGNPPAAYIQRIAAYLNVPTSVDIATFLNS